MKKTVLLATLAILLSPAIASASIYFTEVMYDLEGADAGREWVEVCNSGSDPVDMAGWKFFENGTNHGLTEAQGGTMLSAGTCAIIADNYATFLSEHSGFSGLLFDSSFSLANTTETIILRNAELVDIDTVTYSSDAGVAGDGNSLQNNGGAWVAATPTPGSADLGAPPNPDTTPNAEETNVSEGDTTSDTSNNTGTTETQTNNQTSFTVVPQIFADAGPDYSGVSGGIILFKGQALGKKKEPIASARYIWTFGDGTTAEGKEVYHTYMYPGKYRVVLNVSSGFNSGADMTIADVSTATVSIANVTTGASGFIEIKNTSQKELDISGWVLSGNGREFSVPQGTFILGQEGVVFPAQTTGISVGQGDAVVLMYPNRTEAVRYMWGNAKVAAALPVPAKAATVPAQQQTVQAKAVASVDTFVPAKEDISGEEYFAEDQLAKVVDSQENVPANSIYPWLFSLVLVAGVGVASVFLIKPKGAVVDQNPFAREAEEYEIEEDK